MNRQRKYLTSSLEHQLSAYTLAARAAAVGLLALAQSAEARIVYTSAHVNLGPSSNYDLDLNRDGKRDFVFKDTYHTFLGGARGLLSISPAKQTNHIEGYIRGISHYASALLSGVPVSSKDLFGSGAEVMARATFTGFTGTCYGAWVNVQKRYLGLQFSIKGKLHYGWARLNVSCSKKLVTGTLTGYAYETVPNKPITSGKTHGPDGATLGPSAQGESGMAAWRKKEASKWHVQDFRYANP